MNIVDQLRSEIEERNNRIKEIQENCSHPESAVERKSGSNTGNLLNDDVYWQDCECKLCYKNGGLINDVTL